MAESITVVINCQSLSQISWSLKNRLAQQSLPFHLKVIESDRCPHRLCEIEKIDSDFILFLDQDVILQSPDTLSHIQFLLTQAQQPCLLTGLYLSTNQLNYLQKAYNWLTNQWILLNSVPHENFLSLQNAAGGIWAIKKSNFISLDEWIEPLDWGGEDTRAIRFLKKNGVQILHHPQLDVFHASARSFRTFLKRAFIQGQSRERWNLKSKRQAYFFQILKLSWNSYFPAWLIHSFFVFLGACFEKAKSTSPFAKPHTPPIK